MMHDSALTYLTMGAFFGLTAGISPGPLLTLVITQTLEHGRREGIKVALAPLITDLPIIILTSLVFAKLSRFSILLGLISLLGAVFFIWLGYGTFNVKGLPGIENLKPGSLKKGITANLLNPHPYIFWMSVGVPSAFKAYNISLTAVILYFLLFYIMLTGSKICVALLAEKSKYFLSRRAYIITMRILGAALFLFAVIFIADGIRMLKIN
jgi:threonine/homoserine/homoserine lactone efflux protein